MKLEEVKTKIRFYIAKSKSNHFSGSAWEQRNGKNYKRLAQTTIKHPSAEHAAFELTQILAEKGYR